MLLPDTPTVAGHCADPVIAPQIAVTPVIPTGTLSVNDAPDTSLGPAFDTTTAYDIAEPALTVAGPVLLTVKSAVNCTGVVIEPALLLGFGSTVPAGGVAVAILVIVPLALLATIPVKVTTILLAVPESN